MQSLLREQNKKHEEIIKQQQVNFEAQLSKMNISSSIATHSRTATNENASSVMPTKESESDQEDQESLKRGSNDSRSSSNIKKWDRNHFRQILDNQQSTIRQKLSSRKNSSRKQKTFEYSRELDQNNNSTIGKRMLSFKQIKIADKPQKPLKTPEVMFQDTSSCLNRSAFKSQNNQGDLNHSGSVLSSLIEQRNNTSVMNCTTSTVQNYLEHRHNITKDKMRRYKSERMMKEKSQCTEKPKINKKSLKIAKKLIMSPVDRLYKVGLKKNNPQVLKNKQKLYESQNTFSPQINHKSRSMTRSVQDLYTWNDKKVNDLITKKQASSKKFDSRKVPICPGSASIIKNLDELVNKCSQKIFKVRNFGENGSRNSSRIEEKHNSLNYLKEVEESAINANRLNIKKPKQKAKRKIKGNNLVY